MHGPKVDDSHLTTHNQPATPRLRSVECSPSLQTSNKSVTVFSPSLRASPLRVSQSLGEFRFQKHMITEPKRQKASRVPSTHPQETRKPLFVIPIRILDHPPTNSSTCAAAFRWVWDAVAVIRMTKVLKKLILKRSASEPAPLICPGGDLHTLWNFFTCAARSENQ